MSNALFYGLMIAAIISVLVRGPATDKPRRVPALLAGLIVSTIAVLLYIIVSSRGPAPEWANGALTDDLSDGRDEIAVDLRDGTTDAELAAFGKKHDLELSWVSSDPGILRTALAVARVSLDRQPKVLEELRADPLV